MILFLFAGLPEAPLATEFRSDVIAQLSQIEDQQERQAALSDFEHVVVDSLSSKEVEDLGASLSKESINEEFIKKLNKDVERIQDQKRRLRDQIDTFRSADFEIIAADWLSSGRKERGDYVRDDSLTLEELQDSVEFIRETLERKQKLIEQLKNFPDFNYIKSDWMQERKRDINLYADDESLTLQDLEVAFNFCKDRVVRKRALITELKKMKSNPNFSLIHKDWQEFKKDKADFDKYVVQERTVEELQEVYEFFKKTGAEILALVGRLREAYQTPFVLDAVRLGLYSFMQANSITDFIAYVEGGRALSELKKLNNAFLKQDLNNEPEWTANVQKKDALQNLLVNHFALLNEHDKALLKKWMEKTTKKKDATAINVYTDQELKSYIASSSRELSQLQILAFAIGKIKAEDNIQADKRAIARELRDLYSEKLKQRAPLELLRFILKNRFTDLKLADRALLKKWIKNVTIDKIEAVIDAYTDEQLKTYIATEKRKLWQLQVLAFSIGAIPEDDILASGIAGKDSKDIARKLKVEYTSSRSA
ncbi:MAG: hypothetical protein H6850_02545 [Alphaproteobacteria bacterium]|nr:MAG: hypothetical protein H6850_02545 [Alphaproteobacteria bacterium]